MDHKPLPSTRWLNYARCILDYDPLTGNFTRKEQAHGYGGIKEIGSTAGGDKDGYIKIGIDQVYYSAHVLAYWFIVGQDIPTGTEIDHINRIRNDNRWENLRLVTRSNNNFNSAPGSNNKSGVTGVSWQRDGYWVSRLIKDGVFVLNKVF